MLSVQPKRHPLCARRRLRRLVPTFSRRRWRPLQRFLLLASLAGAPLRLPLWCPFRRTRRRPDPRKQVRIQLDLVVEHLAPLVFEHRLSRSHCGQLSEKYAEPPREMKRRATRRVQYVKLSLTTRCIVLPIPFLVEKTRLPTPLKCAAVLQKGR
jgi:hypothetical protein